MKSIQSYHFFEVLVKHAVKHLIKDTHRKKHPKTKLQRLRKIQILIFGSLVHQINSFQEVLELEQIFQKN